MNTPLQTRGAMACAVFEKRELPDMVTAAASGHHLAAQFAKMIGMWLATPATVRKLECVECHIIFDDSTQAEGFYLAYPVKGDGVPLVCGVCKKCVTKIGSERLLSSAAEHFKKVWPAARIVIDNRG